MDRKIAVKFDNFMSCNITSHCVLVKTKVKYQEGKNYYYTQGRRNVENLCGEKHSLFYQKRGVAKRGPGKSVNPFKLGGGGRLCPSHYCQSSHPGFKELSTPLKIDGTSLCSGCNLLPILTGIGLK